MSTEFLPEADAEFREAVWYYEQEAPGVGMAFIAEVHRAISLIVQNPDAAVAVGGGLRRKILRHFPYNVMYSVEAELVVIVAVAHQKRRPRYWRGRVKKLKERGGRTSASSGPG
jgi:plasmid stabilization system protein ParE